MALQGNIDSFSVTDVLRLLASSAKTGRLAVDGDRGSVGIWLEEGAVVGAASTRRGRRPADGDVADVIFDVLRFREGSFVFDADVRHESPTAAAEVEPAIAAAEAAMLEWESICAVVGSVGSPLTVALELPVPTVELDQLRWSGVCAIAAGGTGRRGAVTVDLLAERLGLGELAAMRLAHDLATLGLIEVGEESADDPIVAAPAADDPFAFAHDAPAAPAVRDLPFEPPPFVPTEPFAATDDGGAAHPGGFDDQSVGEDAFDQGALDRDAFGADPFAADSFSPDPFAADAFAADAFGADPHAPDFLAADALAGDPVAAAFDPGPLGGAEFAAEPVAPAATDGADGPQGVDGLGAIFGSVDPFAHSGPAGTPVVDDDAAQQAEFARQLAMLSPRAAEAVAGAEAGVSAEADERARVARFLGSV